MITHDTRLLQKWIVFIVAIQLSTVEATVTTSCDIPSVDEGQQTKLTCMFSEDISRAQVDFKVELYSLERESRSVPILDCVWFNGKLDCRVHSCCSFDRKVTDNATLVILNATQDLVGKYMCHVVPSSPGSSHFCNFTVNKIVSTDRPTITGTDGVESNSSTVVPVVVGVVVSVIVVVVIAIIVTVYMCRKRRHRNMLSDNIPTEDKNSGSEDSQRQSLTIKEPAHEERKSEGVPLLEKSEVSPLLEKSEVSPLLKKSESLYFDTTDSITALDTGNEKCPKETAGYVKKSTNNPGRPNMFEDIRQSEKMTEAKNSDTTNSETEAKHSDTTNSETEAKHSDTTNSETEAKYSDTTNLETEEINLTIHNKWSPKEEEKYSSLQDTTISQGDLNESRSSSMKPDSENCTPRLPNFDEGARAVQDKAEMDSHNTHLHNLPFGGANPSIKEDSTVNDKESRLCSLAAQDPLVNATNVNDTEVSTSREDFDESAINKLRCLETSGFD